MTHNDGSVDQSWSSSQDTRPQSFSLKWLQ
jgi:hypothetical protein